MKSTPELSLQRAHAGDQKLLLPLIEQYWRFECLDGFDFERVGAVLSRLLSSEELGAGWIVRDQDRAVGYLLMVYVYSLEHGGLTAEIDELYVEPDYRAQHLGQALVRAAESEASQRGCTNLSLQLAVGNDGARGFYRRLGFAPRSAYAIYDKPLPQASACRASGPQ